MAELNPNAVTGLGSKLNTREIVERFMAIEKRRLKPIEARKEEKVEELEAWQMVKAELDKLKGVASALDSDDVWEARNVEVNDDEVLSAKARRDATPGKYTVAVDSVALSHQISSQGFASPDDVIGTGTVRLQVGDSEEDTPITIRLMEGNDTLKALKQAINDSDADVEAYIAKTYGDEPYRLLLTSKRTGEQSRINITLDLEKGAVETPNFENSFDTTAEWKGLDPVEQELKLREVGSSTPVMEVVGEYTGEDDTIIEFTVLRNGTIPSEAGVLLGWKDDKGREGKIEINKFNYVPGQPVDVVDGVQIRFSDGELVAADQFKIKAFAEKSQMLWWMDGDERKARITQPSDWQSKTESGGVHVTGTYEGEDDQTVTLRIQDGGQVGGTKAISLYYEFSESGDSGTVSLSAPYQSGGDDDGLDSATAYDSQDGDELFDLKFNKGEKGAPNKIPIGHGLFVEVPPGVLRDGESTKMDLYAAAPEGYWWLEDEAETRGEEATGAVDQVLEWEGGGAVDLEELDDYEDYLESQEGVNRLSVEDSIASLSGRKSEAAIAISGNYTQDVNNAYTFTVEKRGSVATTRILKLKWEDTFGNSGAIDFGDGYQAGTPVVFDDQLTLSLGEGQLYEGDSFTIEARTATTREAKDLVIRMGASDLGGGLEVRRDKNQANDVIPGLDLEFFAPSEKPVTISVVGDREKARERIRDFVDAYNTFNTTATELSRFDKSTNTAAPLLSDRNLSSVSNEIATISIATVAGLPQSDNMLFAIGLRLNDRGVMSIDEKKLSEKVEDNFAAVADIFRAKGASDNPGVAYVGMNKETQISPVGYKVDVTRVPTRGTFTGQKLPGLIRIDKTNNTLLVKNNGRTSDPIELREDLYTPASLAKAIQKQIAEDKTLGSRGLRVEEHEGALRFTSGSFGSNSKIEVLPGEQKDLSSIGLDEGTVESGGDVEGTIDGVEALGRGQLLAGAKDTNADGLRLLVTLNEAQLEAGQLEASVTITKGVAVKLRNKLEQFTSPINGEFQRITKDLNEQMRSYDKQVGDLMERMESKQSQLQRKFAKLDSTLGRLKAQQSYVSQQLSAMQGGKKKDD